MKFKIVNDKGQSKKIIFANRTAATNAAAYESAKTGESWFAVSASLRWQFSRCIGWFWGR